MWIKIAAQVSGIRMDTIWIALAIWYPRICRSLVPPDRSMDPSHFSRKSYSTDLSQTTFHGYARFEIGTRPASVLAIMFEIQFFFSFFLLLQSGLASAASYPGAPYNCSAIQAGNSQYNLSALGGTYELNGIADGTTQRSFRINI